MKLQNVKISLEISLVRGWGNNLSIILYIHLVIILSKVLHSCILAFDKKHSRVEWVVVTLLMETNWHNDLIEI